jgi:choice-of-anchor B domain-containing protein
MKKIVFFLFALCPIARSAAQAPVQATLLSHWHDPSLPGSAFYANVYNDVWGLSINGREYGIIGSTMGTHFIDITDPAQVFEAFFVPGSAQGTAIIHRDFAEYRGRLYIVCDEMPQQSTVQIVDFRSLPDSVTVVYDSRALFSLAHTVVVDTLNAKMYAGIPRNNQFFHSLGVFSLADPDQPSLLGFHDQIGGVGFSQVHDLFVRDDTVYLNCGPDALVVADFSDGAAPVLLGNLVNYPQRGYNHSGWLSDDGRTYYMADEDHDFDIKACDVHDLQNISVEGLFDAGLPNGSLSIPHNPVVRGHYLYVSYYYEGLVVYDISDPFQPVQVAYYDTYPGPNRNSYEGAWGVYPFLPSGKILVSDMQTGLYVFAPVDPALQAVEAAAENGFSATVFPQPASDGFTLSWDAPRPVAAHFGLWDAAGRQVADWGVCEMPAGNASRPFALPSELCSGVYVLRGFTAEGEVFAEKVVVARF